MAQSMEEQVEWKTKEPATARVEIRPLQSGEDGSAFRTLNEEWISRYFKLEARDIEMLSNTDKILREGGHIFFAYSGAEVVGCVALIPVAEGGVYELSKMAVSPALRGQGIGRQILIYAIEQAKAIPVSRLFLGSSSILRNAVHLYESLGFVHIAPASLPWVAYARADVFMELPL